MDADCARIALALAVPLTWALVARARALGRLRDARRGLLELREELDCLQHELEREHQVSQAGRL